MKLKLKLKFQKFPIPAVDLNTLVKPVISSLSGKHSLLKASFCCCDLFLNHVFFLLYSFKMTSSILMASIVTCIQMIHKLVPPAQLSLCSPRPIFLIPILDLFLDALKAQKLNSRSFLLIYSLKAPPVTPLSICFFKLEIHNSNCPCPSLTFSHPKQQQVLSILSHKYLQNHLLSISTLP